MKKAFLSITLLLIVLSFSQCGPAAEDRFKMHENAKRISDSIGKDIDEGLAKGAIPGSAPAVVNADTTKAK